MVTVVTRQLGESPKTAESEMVRMSGAEAKKMKAEKI